ncbi:unnamed protein product [Anisakis simplex]|uniref:Uncharacterized protein n=1 Tax=Anisakis simplex TaxID=6269 RepID=A0A3P6TLE9_ANISI|nr:unnamed protein product [Anisakis simplex]
MLNETIKEAIDAQRLHNQFMPYQTLYEQTFPKELVDVLSDQYAQNMTATEQVSSVVHALEVRDDGFIHGNCDFRRHISTYPCGF